MELNKINKIKPIKLSKSLLNTLDNIENKQKKTKRTNLNKYILKPKIIDIQPLVKIETGSFVIQL